MSPLPFDSISFFSTGGKNHRWVSFASFLGTWPVSIPSCVSSRMFLLVEINRREGGPLVRDDEDRFDVLRGHWCDTLSWMMRDGSMEQPMFFDRLRFYTFLICMSKWSKLNFWIEMEKEYCKIYNLDVSLRSFMQWCIPCEFLFK